MNKNDELVWCFPRELLEGFKGLPGVSTHWDNRDYFFQKVLPMCVFKRRGDVEENPEQQQVIPYVVCRWRDRILVYNRGVKGAETRLADNWSIGIGGHVNPEDSKYPEMDPTIVFTRAMSRELHEEITQGGFHTNAPMVQYFGLIQSEVTMVDRVHFGVCHEARFLTVSDVAETDEIEKHQWVTLEELKKFKLENWSEMVLRELLK